MKAKDIIVGGRYHLSGDIQNGSFVTHEEVTRKVTRGRYSPMTSL